MKNHTVVKRYAKALLEIGLENGHYDQYGTQLQDFASAIAETGDIAKVITTPAFPLEIRKKILEAILSKSDLDHMVANFIRLLMDKMRFDDLCDIAQAYKNLSDEQNGIVRGSLCTAVPLSDESVNAIKAALSKFSGKTVELTVQQDESIIGGLVAKLGDLTIDGSVRTQIMKLSHLLESN